MPAAWPIVTYWLVPLNWRAPETPGTGAAVGWREPEAKGRRAARRAIAARDADHLRGEGRRSIFVRLLRAGARSDLEYGGRQLRSAPGGASFAALGVYHISPIWSRGSGGRLESVWRRPVSPFGLWIPDGDRPFSRGRRPSAVPMNSGMVVVAGGADALSA